MTIGSADTRGSLFPEREFAFGAREFRAIADALRDEAGIALPEGKAPLVYSRLVKRVRALGLANFDEYCRLIHTQDGRERVHMVAALTTNITRFFREAHHFEHLKAKVLPSLLKQARGGQCVRIWSAGCASGEEPYSIALTILEMAPDAAKLDVKILATDIDVEILRRAREGRYTEAAVAPIALAQRRRWMIENNEAGAPVWLAGDEMRALVSLRRLNLLDEWPMRKKMDVVFCRNVMIYFDEDVRSSLWPRLAAALAPGGILFVGHSERVVDANRQFHVVGMTAYEYRPKRDFQSYEEAL